MLHTGMVSHHCEFSCAASECQIVRLSTHTYHTRRVYPHCESSCAASCYELIGRNRYTECIGFAGPGFGDRYILYYF